MCCRHGNRALCRANALHARVHHDGQRWIASTVYNSVCNLFRFTSFFNVLPFSSILANLFSFPSFSSWFLRFFLNLSWSVSCFYIYLTYTHTYINILHIIYIKYKHVFSLFPVEFPSPVIVASIHVNLRRWNTYLSVTTREETTSAH